MHYKSTFFSHATSVSREQMPIGALTYNVQPVAEVYLSHRNKKCLVLPNPCCLWAVHEWNTTLNSAIEELYNCNSSTALQDNILYCHCTQCTVSVV